MEKKKLNDKILIDILKTRYNDREVALYLLKKAKDASFRAKNNADANNPLAMAHNIAEVDSNLSLLEKLLNITGSLAEDSK